MMKRFFSKKVTGFLFLFLFLTLCFVFRIQILRSAGNFLISENELRKADAIFVLGGDSYDRGNLAVKLFNDGYSQKIICLGENVPTIFKALGISYAESEVTKINISSPLPPLQGRGEQGAMEEEKIIPDSSVIILKKGTSTKEESEAIVDYCKNNNIGKAIVISSKFHTRRVRMVCAELFEKNNIELIIAGAPSSVYSENEWWKSEEGLIMVNNEYVKLVYYMLKY